MLVYIQDFLILQGVLYIAYIFFSSFNLVRMVMCNEIHNTDHLLSLFVFLTVVVECTSAEYVISVLGLTMDARCTCFSLRVSFASSESYMLCYGKLLCICVWVNCTLPEFNECDRVLPVVNICRTGNSEPLLKKLRCFNFLF